MKNKNGHLSPIVAFFMILLLLPLSGCEKAPFNSDIEGFWRLDKFVTHADGVTAMPDGLFFSIQLWLVQVSDKQGSGNVQSFTGRYAFDETTNTVKMWDFSMVGLSGEPLYATVEQLAPYGIGALETVFDVVEAGGGHLVLRSEYSTLYLSRF